MRDSAKPSFLRPCGSDVMDDVRVRQHGCVSMLVEDSTFCYYGYSCPPLVLRGLRFMFSIFVTLDSGELHVQLLVAAVGHDGWEQWAGLGFGGVEGRAIFGDRPPTTMTFTVEMLEA